MAIGPYPGAWSGGGQGDSQHIARWRLARRRAELSESRWARRLSGRPPCLARSTAQSLRGGLWPPLALRTREVIVLYGVRCVLRPSLQRWPAHSRAAREERAQTNQRPSAHGLAPAGRSAPALSDAVFWSCCLLSASTVCYVLSAVLCTVCCVLLLSAVCCLLSAGVALLSPLAALSHPWLAPALSLGYSPCAGRGKASTGRRGSAASYILYRGGRQVGASRARCRN